MTAPAPTWWRRLPRNAPSSSGALPAAIAGAVLAAAGAGLAGPHVVKGGDVLDIITGGALFTIGLLLFVGPVWATVRRASTARRVVVVLGAIAIAALSTELVAIPVMVTHVPATHVGSTTPADVGLAYVDVTMTTADGVELSAWYVPSTNGAAAVLLHGAGSTRAGVLDQAAVLASHGYGALLLDARGHGQSGGRAMDFGWHGDDDVAAATAWLDGRADVDPGRIAVLGLSMGGEEAIGAAAADDRIAAVVAEGATARVADDFAWLSDSYGLRGVVQEGVEHLQQAVTDRLTDAAPPIALHRAVAEMAPRPALLIAAGEVAEEGSAGRWIQSAAPDTVTLWVVPGSDHTGGLDTDPDGWEARVTSFLDAALGLGGTA